MSATEASSRSLLTWDEAASYLGPSFSARQLKKFVYDHRSLPTVRLGGKVWIERAALDALVEAMRRQPGEL